ncbi:MAG: hypothetical protein QXJ74_10250 [Nitrososphaera sp.]|uniref:hypothetical protein n=1 Tax=Nitrososphaera sp. TaxID=1971748 RepID=UPI00316BEC07
MSSNSQGKKRALLIVVVVGVGALAALGYYVSSNSSFFNNSPNEADGSGVSRLNLVSVKAYDINHDLIGEVESGQSFKVDQPVLIQTEFSNPDANSREHIITSEIRGNSGTEALTTVRVDIAASGDASVEVYWQPEEIGNYDLLIFAFEPEDLNRGPVIEPLKMIRLSVIE